MVDFSLKASGTGLVAILAVAGALLLFTGTGTNNQQMVSAGWGLVTIAVVLFIVALIVRRM